MRIEPEQRNGPFNQDALPNFARQKGTPRTSIKLLNYSSVESSEQRLKLQTMDFSGFNETDAANMFESMGACGLKLSDAWYASWAYPPLGSSENMMDDMPIIVVLPGDGDGPQVLTAVCTFLQREGSPQMEEPHIRWLHRM